MKILHTADWHNRDKDHDETEKCINVMVASARQEKPDIILIQNLKPDSRSANTIYRQVSDLADVAPVAVIPPSHDGTSAEILRYVRGKHRIHVSEKPEQLFLAGGCLYTVDSGVPACTKITAVITQIPTPTKELTALVKAFGLVASYHHCPHILSVQDIKISVDQMDMAGADLVCLGHIQKQQEIGSNLFYSGSICRKTFGKTEDKGFSYHTIHDNQVVESRFVQVPARQMVKTIKDSTVENDLQALEADHKEKAGALDRAAAEIASKLKKLRSDYEFNRMTLVNATTEGLEIKVEIERLKAEAKALEEERTGLWSGQECLTRPS